ncbi:L-iditol 2-dehydrogenase [Aphelenchoides bicaudatus]|nr:L-iditol 2-dehydrogenase [Aphelenchoides bicaudatus]
MTNQYGLNSTSKKLSTPKQQWDNVLSNRRDLADQKNENELKKRTDYKLMRGISAKQEDAKQEAGEKSSKSKPSSTSTYASLSEPAVKAEKVDRPPVKPAFGIAMPSIQAAKATSSEDSKKTIFITYAIHGHAYNLAKRYLEEGHRVILHCVEPRNTQNIQKLVVEYGKEVCLPVCGHLQDDDFVERVILTGIKKFGRIDTVFHFASSNCQVRPLNQDENFSYMFDVNVKPLQLIVKHLMQHQRNTKFVKLIGVGPVIQSGVRLKQSVILEFAVAWNIWQPLSRAPETLQLFHLKRLYSHSTNKMKRELTLRSSANLYVQSL